MVPTKPGEHCQAVAKVRVRDWVIVRARVRAGLRIRVI